MLFECWAIVYDAILILKQHQFNAPCLPPSNHDLFFRYLPIEPDFRHVIGRDVLDQSHN